MGNERLSRWRAQRQATLPLPSGLSVRVRKIELLDLVGTGKIPAPMLSEFQRAAEPGADVAQVGMEKLLDVLPMINEVVLAAVVDPPVAKEADEEHLGLEELPLNDKLTIFNWTQEEAVALAGFHQGQAQPLDPPLLVHGIRDEAEPDPGPGEQLDHVPV